MESKLQAVVIHVRRTDMDWTQLSLGRDLFMGLHPTLTQLAYYISICINRGVGPRLFPFRYGGRSLPPMCRLFDWRHRLQIAASTVSFGLAAFSGVPCSFLHVSAYYLFTASSLALFTAPSWCKSDTRERFALVNLEDKASMWVVSGLNGY
ncbi:OLC1v1029671C1 [Oldenlandia corymbosa var. corymbosa]|uniref:OLC1v1029671C1 n=1 Tax=Oldenlandia corymbosa var. corymbosa TaxID=529605 RepID=A0AAV1CG64_OLDCO|nr:OLC1v1029671C1 [Oldenlandia corymbosa var. corymbosa]